VTNFKSPGRNDPCWCGSGVKFKKCHLGREDEQPLHPGELQRSIRQDFCKKGCLHPEAAVGLCNKIIDAHTVQRANTLQALLDAENHVLSFHPFVPDSDGQPKLQKLGWRKASTFTGFCGNHDSKTFEPVERGAFSFTPETAFLLTYRALCHEYFQKQASARARLHHQPLIDRGQSPERQREIQHRFRLGLAGVQKAIDDLVEIKRLADKDLLARDYTNWQFVCLAFSGPLCFAASGAPTPNQDLLRAPLQTLHDPTSILQHLYVSVVASERSPRVVLGWRKEHSAPRRFVDSLLAAPSRLFPAYFVQYVFAHLENVYFSSEWWESLARIDQERIRALAVNANAYYFPPEYTPSPSVPWSLESIERFNAAA
jgi:hypothetical protein